jgi:hypothetical protein
MVNLNKLHCVLVTIRQKPQFRFAVLKAIFTQQLPHPPKNPIKHGFSQFTGKSILLARLKSAEQSQT